MSALHFYLYAAIAPTRQSLGKGIAGESLRAFARGALVIVAGAIPGAPDVAPRALRAHDRVVRRLVDASKAVVPFRFGTVVSSERALDDAVARIEDDLREALRLVRGREQMTLRLFSDAKEPPRAQRRMRVGEGAAYLAARAAVVDDAPAVARLHRALGKLVRAERTERHDAPPLCASLYHLVDRGRSAQYRACVERAEASIAPLRAHVSGPWAPYAFGCGPWR